MGDDDLASDHLDTSRPFSRDGTDSDIATAPFSVMRGALIGAAQSLWILGASGPTDRQQCSLNIAIEWLTQHIG